MKLYELVRENRLIKEKVSTFKKYTVKVLSNTTVNSIIPYLEYSLRSEGINADVNISGYDNLVQDSFDDNFNAYVIFLDICNIVEGFQYSVLIMSDEQISTVIEKLKSEIDLILNNLAETPVILWNKFSALVFNCNNIRSNKFDEVCDILNEYLESRNSSNIVIIDIEKIISIVGVTQAVNFRDFYSSKALYSNKYYESYVDFIKPIFLSLNGMSKKVIVMDCDNTLWNGIVGEDGVAGISMSKNDYENSVFAEVQQYLNYLAMQGVVIGVASKNNPEDIDEVLNENLNITLKNEYVTIKKVNWESKTSNLLKIAKAVNLNVDSLVFVDDSKFEINLIREKIPKIKSFLVPEIKGMYPDMFRKLIPLFYDVSATIEDKKRNEMYKVQFERDAQKNKFTDIDDYLASLEIELIISMDNVNNVSRLSQITQKTNQFNLTTKRFSETEIFKLINDPSYIVIDVSVSDKYGCSGLTCMAIIQIKSEDVSIINTFLMSCRVLGRNIEFSFFDEIIKIMKKRNTKIIKMNYIASLKNMQVSDLYERFGAKLEKYDKISKQYCLNLDEYSFFDLKYIGVTSGS